MPRLRLGYDESPTQLNFGVGRSPASSRRKVTTDIRVGIGAVALYVVLALLLLPASEYTRALGAAALVFGGVATMAGRLGRGPLPGMSVLAVAFVATAVLVMPTFPAMGGAVRAATPVGFVGVQAAVLLWAALRWTPRTAPRERTQLRKALRVGALAACGLSAIATVGILLAFGREGRRAAPLLLVYPAYFAGMLGAAAVFWALQCVAHLEAGRYAIGVLGGSFLYGAVAPIVALIRREPLVLSDMSMIALVCASDVGPAVALNGLQGVAGSNPAVPIV